MSFIPLMGVNLIPGRIPKQQPDRLCGCLSLPIEWESCGYALLIQVGVINIVRAIDKVVAERGIYAASTCDTPEALCIIRTDQAFVRRSGINANGD
jgi:hypothetical protein